MKKPALIILCLCMAALIHAQSTLDSGLIAHYKFNGNTNDVSGNNHHLTNSGATAVADKYGSSGMAYYFDGSSAYMFANAPAADFSVSSYSCSFWINPEATQLANPRIFAVTPGSTYFHEYFCFIETTGGSRYGIAAHTPTGGYNLYMLSTATYTPNVWKHIVITFHNGVCNIYVNALLNATTSGAAPIQTFTSGHFLLIGASHHPSAPQARYKGSLDEMRFYNRELTDVEVGSLFSESNPTNVSVTEMNRLRFYPNPSANGQISIENPLNGLVSYEIINTMGQKVAGVNLNTLRSIDLSGLSNGYYFIRIISDDKLYSAKVLINNN